jgi:hypothetical protein
VLRQDHEARYPDSMHAVFAALNRVLAKHRWGVLGQGDEVDVQPKVGCRYARQSKSVLRRGRVLEVIRPVSLTLYETLYDPPCRVRLQLRWRLHPLDDGSLLHLALSYQLNGAAALRGRHWDVHLHAHCLRMLKFVAADLERARKARAPAPSATEFQET